MEPFNKLAGRVLLGLKAVSINVRFVRAGEALIVFDARHARVSRFSKLAPPARAKRLQWKPALKPLALLARDFKPNKTLLLVY